MFLYNNEWQIGVSVLLAVIVTTETVSVMFPLKDNDKDTLNTTKAYLKTSPTCKIDQYYCQDFHCLDDVFLCDGVKDCPHGDDETHQTCVSCRADQFMCIRKNTCVSKKVLCDGEMNCADGSDEEMCVILTTSGDVVMASRTGNAAMKVCYSGISKELEEVVCKMNGFKGSVGSTKTPTTTHNNYTVIDRIMNTFNTPIAKTHVVSTCADGLWSLNCSKWECGTRAEGGTYGQYIINGFKAVKGAWPWSGILKVFEKNKIRLCGAVLIDKRFVLTAAHCVFDNNIKQIIDSNIIRITLGSVSSNYRPNFQVEKIVVHPSYSSKPVINDLALLKLNKDVIFSDNINAICLPPNNLDQTKYKVCVSVGYGKTSSNKVSVDLLQTRLNIMPNKKCAQHRNQHNYHVNNNTLCVNSIPGIGRNNICNGDSGGPLGCMDEWGRWFVAGIHSYTYRIDFSTNYNDYRNCQASVVVNVARYEQWINDEKSKMV